MRYRINHSILIRSENAAKPNAQSSAFLRSFIAGLPPVAASFDYGCGKLRYRDAILETTDSLVLVDSEIQLSRPQVIAGQVTTVRAASGLSNRMNVMNAGEFDRLTQQFDRGFCINVLSVIPIDAIRRRVLSIIRSKLRPSGICLFVVQYRNSDFKRMLAMPNARPWCNGILVDSLRGFSFYGLIPPEQLISMVTDVGFEVIDRTLNDGSVYLMARALD